ncbi:MAG: endo alpha-1,4 polygalactosaminidase [Myxococcaceae bacterium]
MVDSSSGERRRRAWPGPLLSAALACAIASGCSGIIGTPDGDEDGGPPADSGSGGAQDSGALDAGRDGGAAVWSPSPGATWQWQLTGTIDTTVDAGMYDLDLFDAPQGTIDALRAGGRVVICYFSAGSYEDWRPDEQAFPAAGLGKALAGWPGERWLDTRNLAVRGVMKARLDLAVARGCHGVEPDNVDGYANDPGFPLTGQTQLDYNLFLAREAHARGLSIGLKNDLDQIPQLVGHFDWALDEECFAYNECPLLTPFIAAGKAVFHVEYGAASKAGTVCPATRPLGFSSLIKNLDLDAWRVACP